MAHLVNKRELAAILGVSERSLTAWQAEDPPMPIEAGRERLGEENQYDTAKVIDWMIERALRKAKLETARDRLARVQADEVEMRMAEKRGELVPASEIEPAWAGMVIAARQALLAVPANTAPLLMQLADVDAIRDLLEDAIADALTKLAGSENDERGAETTATGDAG